MPLHIGITGGIGSGKSIVSRIFHSLGVPVFDADQIAKSAYANVSVKQQVESEFGSSIFVENQLDTIALGKIVFSDPVQLKKLESIIHPFVHQQWARFEQKHSAAVYILRESALLISSGSYVDCDKIILVSASKPVKLARVQQRSRLSISEIEKRMSLQLTDEESLPYCDFVIRNNEQDSLIQQVMRIHLQLTEEHQGIHK